MDQRMLNLLREAKVIAVVGISDKPERPSHQVAAYLQTQGYRIVPINPGLASVLGRPCFSTLSACGEPVDIVDIFRASEAVPPIVDEAILTGAKAIWMQEGVSNAEAAAKAEAAGLQVVQDQCIKRVLMTYGGRP